MVFGQTCCLAACLAASPHPWTSGMEHLRQNRSRQNLQVALRVWTPTLQPSPRHTWNNSVPLIPSFSLSKIFSSTLSVWVKLSSSASISSSSFFAWFFFFDFPPDFEDWCWGSTLGLLHRILCNSMLSFGTSLRQVEQQVIEFEALLHKGIGFLYIYSYKQNIWQKEIATPNVCSPTLKEYSKVMFTFSSCTSC